MASVVLPGRQVCNHCTSFDSSNVFQGPSLSSAPLHHSLCVPFIGDAASGKPGTGRPAPKLFP